MCLGRQSIHPISGVRCPHMPFVPVSLLAAYTPHNKYDQHVITLDNTNRLVYKPRGLPHFSIKMSSEQTSK